MRPAAAASDSSPGQSQRFAIDGSGERGTSERGTSGERLRWQSNCGYDPRLYAQTNISAPGIRSDRCRGSNQRTSGGDSFHPSGFSGARCPGRREYDAVAVSQATWPAGCKPCGESPLTEETPPEDVRRGSEENQRGSEEAVGGSEGEEVTGSGPLPLSPPVDTLD